MKSKMGYSNVSMLKELGAMVVLNGASERWSNRKTKSPIPVIPFTVENPK